MRAKLAGIGLILLLSACGPDESSLTEYVDELNAIEGQVTAEAGPLIAELERVQTPNELKTTMEQLVAVRIDSLAASRALDPPEQVADLHDFFVEWEAQLIPVEEALAARAGTVAGWEELSESDEMEAYRVTLIDGKQRCIEFQAKLDATAARGVFADTPWIPGEMKEVVEAVLGCDLFPENPENIWRLPSTTKPP